MVIICVDCLKNGFYSDYMVLKSCSLLPVFDKTLLSYQLKNFASLNVEKVFAECSGESQLTVIDGVYSVEYKDISKILKALFVMPKTTPVILIKNNCYFEIDGNLFKKNNGCFSLCSNENLIPFAVFSNVENVIKTITSFENLTHLFDKYGENKKIECYYKEVITYKDYLSLLFDVLNGKTEFHPPLIAERIYTDAVIPEGDYTIVPPVFLKDGVQIESGAVIGPNAVIMKDAVIGKNSLVRCSVLMNDVFVSSGCYIDGSLLCDNAIVKRNGSVFKGSIIGSDSVLGENFVVENNSKIKPYVKTDKSVKKSFLADSEDRENLFGFYNLPPEKAAVLGSAVGTVFEGLSVGVASDGTYNSLSVKLSLLGGLISVGSDCTDFGNYHNSRIFFDTFFCDLDYCIFISGGAAGTNVTIYSKDFLPVSNTDFYNILNAVKQQNFKHCNSENCRGVKQIKGLGKMYLRQISAMFSKPLKFRIICKSDNSFVNKTVKDALYLIGQDNLINEEIILNYNTTATKVYLEYSDIIINYNKLLRFAEFYCVQAKKKGVGYNEVLEKIRRFDSIFLSFFVLSVINDSELSITELFEKIPQFFVMEETIAGSLKSTDFIKITSSGSKIFCKNNSVFIKDKNVKAKIKNTTENGKVKICVKAANAEAAEEFISNFKTIIGYT